MQKHVASSYVAVMSTDLAQLTNDRYEVAEALYRYAYGLDHDNAEALGSALSEDCVLDFRPANKKLHLDFTVVSGRQAILDSVLPFIGPLDTTHSASNLRIEISGDSASLSAYVLAQHFMPRQGSRPGAEYALLMNRYDCELSRDGEKWRFKRITIDNAWCQGNPEILNALASHRVLTSKPRP